MDDATIDHLADTLLRQLAAYTQHLKDHPEEGEHPMVRKTMVRDMLRMVASVTLRGAAMRLQRFAEKTTAKENW